MPTDGRAAASRLGAAGMRQHPLMSAHSAQISGAPRRPANGKGGWRQAAARRAPQSGGPPLVAQELGGGPGRAARPYRHTHGRRCGACLAPICGARARIGPGPNGFPRPGSGRPGGPARAQATHPAACDLLIAEARPAAS